MEFYQEGPDLINTFKNDALLTKWLEKKWPADVWNSTKNHLAHVGELAVTDWLRWSQDAENNPPQHIPFDPWGRRIDLIQLNDSWKKLENAAATEGIVASAYERKFGEHSRVYQATLLYLFHSSSAFVSCPLAMTDGAARAIELFGNTSLKSGAFMHLTSRDPAKFWTSGQWMTERSGGSDVSDTSTVATPLTGTPGWEWQLEGVKWFSSATTSQMAMLLARPQGAENGSRGLSLFYTELRDDHGSLKNIEVLRLKNKLGTKALPTAELRLRATPAKLVGGEGSGVKKISALFNITRVYNSICALSHLRRALDLAQSYSKKRVTFGKKLIEHPLQASLLHELETQFAKCFALTFYVAHLLGKDECGNTSPEETSLLRALTPVVKIFTARQCMWGVSEVVEIFGGAGYVEDSGIPRLLRDAQVFSIWEGGTNVLALDFLRAVLKEDIGPALNEKFKRDFAPSATPEEKNRWENLIREIRDEHRARHVVFELADLFGTWLAR